MAPFSSLIGVTALESSAYGRCSWASRYVDRTRGFRSPGGITMRRLLRSGNWWLPREPRRRLNGDPGRLRLACTRDMDYICVSGPEHH